jgi:hypothetical protein
MPASPRGTGGGAALVPLPGPGGGGHQRLRDGDRPARRPDGDPRPAFRDPGGLLPGGRSGRTGRGPGPLPGPERGRATGRCTAPSWTPPIPPPHARGLVGSSSGGDRPGSAAPAPGWAGGRSAAVRPIRPGGELPEGAILAHFGERGEAEGGCPACDRMLRLGKPFSVPGIRVPLKPGRADGVDPRPAGQVPGSGVPGGVEDGFHPVPPPPDPEPAGSSIHLAYPARFHGPLSQRRPPGLGEEGPGLCGRGHRTRGPGTRCGVPVPLGERQAPWRSGASWASHPRELGGLGKDALTYLLTVQELARYDASHAITVSAHTTLGTYPHPELRDRRPAGAVRSPPRPGRRAGGLRPHRARRGLGRLREPDPGGPGGRRTGGSTDPRSSSPTPASGRSSPPPRSPIPGRVPGDHELRRHQAHHRSRGGRAVGMGSVADLGYVDGVQAGKKEDKMGWRASDTRELLLEDALGSRREPGGPRARASSTS